jgi:hypothetical protein
MVTFARFEDETVVLEHASEPLPVDRAKLSHRADLGPNTLLAEFDTPHWR